MPNHFHKNLQKLRESRGLSRIGLSDQLPFISTGNIYTWETASQAPYERLIELADFFNVTIDDLLRSEIKI